MSTNPYEPPKEPIIANGPLDPPYTFRWWHALIGLLVIAAILTIGDRLLHMIWIDSPGPPRPN
jgi:hypothetical protein